MADQQRERNNKRVIKARRSVPCQCQPVVVVGVVLLDEPEAGGEEAVQGAVVGDVQDLK